jgi:hypothetical protein
VETSFDREPIRIIVEIVIKHEYPPQVLRESKNKNIDLAGGAGNLDFKFQFKRTNVTVISLEIEDKILQNPSDSGTLTLSAAPIGEVSITAVAVGPGGTGNMQISYMGKDLFSAPVEFPMENGHGTIDEIVNLP